MDRCSRPIALLLHRVKAFVISQTQLRQWSDFLQNQIVALDAAYLAKMGEPHVASVPLVAFLKVNDAMARERVERAVAAFADSEALWPPSLTGDQIANLTHRANCAQGILQAIVRQQLPANSLAVLDAPHPKKRSKFIRWLFIDLWNHSGSVYLETLTNKYLEDNQ